MTVPVLPDADRKTTYSPTASTGPFAVGFNIYADGTDYANWLQVYVNGVLKSGGTDWTLSSPSGGFATLARPITDAVVTLTSPATGTVLIEGARRPRRLTQQTEGQPYTATDVNLALTDVVAMLREGWTRDADASTALLAAIALFTSVTAGSTAVNIFASLAAAKLANIPSSTLYVYAAGYSTQGDGGESLSKQIPGPVVTPDQWSSSNGTCFQYVMREQTPQHYGAKANGTDDSTALQNWLTRLLRADGVTGRLNGQYTYGTTLTIPAVADTNRNGLIIRGSGFDGCGLFYTGTGDGIDIMAVNDGGGVGSRNVGFCFSDFILDGNNTGAVGIYTMNLLDAVFERVHIKNFKNHDVELDGTVAYGAQHVAFRDCKMSPGSAAAPGSYCIYAKLSNYLTIDNCYFNGALVRTTLINNAGDTTRIVHSIFESAVHGYTSSGGDLTAFGNGFTSISGTKAILTANSNSKIAGERAVTNAATDIDYGAVTLGGVLNFEPEGQGSPVMMPMEIGPWRIVAGRLSTTTNGAPISGGGFTCSSNATGDNTITFSPGFNLAPKVVWTPTSSAVMSVNKVTPTSTTARVQVYNTSGIAADATVDFIAIGPISR